MGGAQGWRVSTLGLWVPASQQHTCLWCKNRANDVSVTGLKVLRFYRAQKSQETEPWGTVVMGFNDSG